MTDGGRAGGGYPVEVRTKFERFPATVKGAFVMRGSDGDPHRVRLASAVVARIPGGPTRAVPVEETVVDVAPARDLFVPFEVPVTDLDPGWYVIRSTIEVDGGRPREFDSRPFAVPWSRGEVRRGTVPLDRSVAVGGTSIRLDRVEMGPEAVAVFWEPERQEAGTEGMGMALEADGRPLEPLPPSAGKLLAGHQRRALAYPVPREARALSVAATAASGERSEPITIPLG